jgi:hypothetical protein
VGRQQRNDVAPHPTRAEDAVEEDEGLAIALAQHKTRLPR